MKVVKKCVLLAVVFSLVLLLCPCMYAVPTNASDVFIVSDGQNNVSDSKAKLKKAERAANKAKKKAEEAEKKNKKEASRFASRDTDVSSGDKKTAFSSKTIEVSDGKVKILMKGALGSFQLYALDNEKSIPLLSGNDEFTSSFYALRVGKKDFKLTNNIGVLVGARKIENCVQMMYSIPKVACVLLTYECISSYPGEQKDMLKITASVLNVGKKADTFSLKTVFDTCLGEQKGPHFSTADNKEINKEMQFQKFDSAKWIISGNDTASMQILLYGADITVPNVVSLANKDLLSMPTWIPNVYGAKNFDSVVSYNNSSVCINWADVMLSPEEEVSFVYYIAVATAGEIPQGEKFIEWQASLHSDEKEASYVPEQKVKDGGSSSQIYIDPEKLSREYIQSLIDRINALENNSQMVDRSELMMLNAELDLILEKLRQM
ncbi:MAG: hypothetical protein K2M99_02965 [Treponemataceae bacterium]|nr:hypothetical protein [Treponemataceae bacterium]